MWRLFVIVTFSVKLLFCDFLFFFFWSKIEQPPTQSFWDHNPFPFLANGSARSSPKLASARVKKVLLKGEGLSGLALVSGQGPNPHAGETDSPGLPQAKGFKSTTCRRITASSLMQCNTEGSIWTPALSVTLIKQTTEQFLYVYGGLAFLSERFIFFSAVIWYVW